MKMNIWTKEIKSQYFNHVTTTKHLIYKANKIEATKIKESYHIKSNAGIFTKLPLIFGQKHHFYYNDTFDHLLKMASILNKLILKNQEFNANSNNQDLIGEIQNSLWIETVKSSRIQIKEVLRNFKENQNQKLPDSNLILNLNQGFDFIKTKPEINQENLSALYTILTKNIDLGVNKLDNYPYRNYDVKIGDDQGLAPSEIKNSMDQIFAFINEPSKQLNNQQYIINALLIHYVFELIHPYYDFNGRMGRLLSLWYLKDHDFPIEILNFSKAINAKRQDLYYQAFKKSKEKEFKGDATFFVASLLLALINYQSSLLMANLIHQKIKICHKVKLNSLELDILINLASQEKGKFYLIKDFIIDYQLINPSLISRALQKLVKLKVINVINTNPKEYQIILANDYQELDEYLKDQK